MFTDFLFLFFQLYLGGVFLWSGISKVLSLKQFILGLDSYELFPYKLTHIVALIVIGIELLIAYSHLFSWNFSIVAKMSLVFIALLTFVVALTLSREIEVSCMCFGAADETKVSRFTLIRLAVWFSIEVFLIAFSDFGSSEYTRSFFDGANLFFVMSSAFMAIILVRWFEEFFNYVRHEEV